MKDKIWKFEMRKGADTLLQLQIDYSRVLEINILMFEVKATKSYSVPALGIFALGSLISQSQAVVFSDIRGEITSVGPAGASLGLTVGMPITAFGELIANSSDVEFSGAEGPTTYSVWASGQIGPGNGSFDFNYTITVGGHSWSTNAPTFGGSFYDAVVSVNDGDGNQSEAGNGSIGDELFITSATRNPANFPSFPTSGADPAGILSLEFYDLNAPFDFINDSTIIPEIGYDAAVGVGEVFFVEDDFGSSVPQELFTYSISQIPEPGISILCLLSLSGLLARRRS